MIPRIIIILTIAVAAMASIALPKTHFNIPYLSKAPTKVESEKTSIGLFPVGKYQKQNTPEISARSAFIVDFKTGITLFEKNPNLKHLPASTTKLMTVLVALEKCTTETVVTVGNFSNIGNQMGLQTGDQITVENLIYGLLIKSGNDAAYALAYACSQSLASFVDSMNEKAKSLEMLNTRFANPAGFDDQLQYSTAKDLAKLAKVAMANPLISKIVTVKSTVVTDISGNKTYYLENVNKLLNEIEGIEGIKTGQTNGSLEILITKTTREGNSIIIVLLGSQDRFEESKRLIEWTFANHHWVGS